MSYEKCTFFTVKLPKLTRPIISVALVICNIFDDSITSTVVFADWASRLFIRDSKQYSHTTWTALWAQCDRKRFFKRFWWVEKRCLKARRGLGQRCGKISEKHVKLWRNMSAKWLYMQYIQCIRLWNISSQSSLRVKNVPYVIIVCSMWYFLSFGHRIHLYAGAWKTTSLSAHGDSCCL